MIYSGHEYTKSNIEFALTVDPQNDKLKASRKSIDSIAKGIPTVPVNIRRGIRH